MRIGNIVSRLREKNLSFGELIGGAAELSLAINNTLKQEMAFVIPLLDSGAPNEHDTTVIQNITERFGIVVAIANDSSQADKLGIIAYNRIHSMRGELFTALLGWQPRAGWTQIQYRGGRLVDFNSAYLWWQFEFEYTSKVDTSQIASGSTDVVDGLIETDFDDAEIPVSFDKIYANIILTPSARVPYDGALPLADNYPDVELPDNAAQMIDLTDDPRFGEYGKAFSSQFDIYEIN